MDNQFKYFMDDLIALVREKYNLTSHSSKSEEKNDQLYRVGMNFGYYDILSIIDSQLEVTDLKKNFRNEITPILGQKSQNT